LGVGQEGVIMLYVACGTVQIEQKTNATKGSSTNFSIWINPVQGYSVSHGSDNFTVFMGDGHEALVYKKDHPFTTNRRFVRQLTDAAVHRINVEIGIDKSGEIKSLKIPATR
jgi:hypothetical protein